MAAVVEWWFAFGHRGHPARFVQIWYGIRAHRHHSVSAHV
jgi:hypothetical protein